MSILLASTHLFVLHQILSTLNFTGLRLENATIDHYVLGKVDNLYMSITDISVHLLEITLPSWSRPLTVTLKGVSVELMQRNLPQVSVLSSIVQECYSAFVVT